MPKLAERTSQTEEIKALLDTYRMMVLVRLFEESTYRKFREGKMGGYLHRYDGQEAIVCGVVPFMEIPGDYLLCTYRGHAHALAIGSEPGAVMAELMGRSTGCALGKGGSMHLIEPQVGFLGGDGIVGGPVPVAIGVGYALKYREAKNLCICYFGDGAMNQGGVHEAMNMAGLYELPVLFILENNRYAMGTSLERSTAQPDFVLKAKAHGIDGEAVDGMDILTVRSVVDRVVKEMRQTGKPYFLEMQCYRFMGHGIGDDNTQGQRFYRSEDEVNEWREKDPITKLRKYLIAQGALSDETAEAIEADAQKIVDDAVAFAEASPEPPLDSLYENVYA